MSSISMERKENEKEKEKGQGWRRKITKPFSSKDEEKPKDARTQLTEMTAALVEFRDLWDKEHHVLGLPPQTASEKKKSDSMSLQQDLLNSFRKRLLEELNRKQMTNIQIAERVENRAERFRSELLEIQSLLHEFLDAQYPEMLLGINRKALDLTRFSIGQHDTQIQNFRVMDQNSAELREQQERSNKEVKRLTGLLAQSNSRINELLEEREKHSGERVAAEGKLNAEIYRLKQQKEDLAKSHQQKMAEEQKKATSIQGRMTSDHESKVRDIIQASENELKRVQYESESQRQVMQAAMVSSNDLTETLTDSDLTFQFKQLKSAVDTLARAPFWGKTSSPSIINTLGEVTGFPRVASAMPSKHHKLLLEQAIWRILLEELLADPLGLRAAGRTGTSLTETWCLLFNRGQNRAPGDKDAGKSSTGRLPQRSPLSEQWRASTVEALRRHTLEKAATDENLGGIKVDQVAVRDDAQERLRDLLHNVATEPMEKEVHSLVEKAATIAFLFGIQKARVEFYRPSVHDTSTTQPGAVEVCNDDGSWRTDSPFVFDVSPGLRKWGNTRGGALDTMSVLLPARVYI